MSEEPEMKSETFDSENTEKVFIVEVTAVDTCSPPHQYTHHV